MCYSVLAIFISAKSLFLFAVDFVHSVRRKLILTTMNLKDLMLQDGKVTVAVTLEELRAWHDELIGTPQIQSSEKHQTKEALMTHKEVISLLGVDSSTLWRWAKTGYLSPVNFGGQWRYRKAEVDAIINGVKR